MGLRSQYGHTISRRFHHTKPPPSDVRPTCDGGAGHSGPETPVGARIVNPPVGGGVAHPERLSDALAMKSIAAHRQLERF